LKNSRERERKTLACINNWLWHDRWTIDFFENSIIILSRNKQKKRKKEICNELSSPI
jgi:hypothetical protein